MNLQNSIESAIGAHGLWKAHIRSAIQTGKSEVTVATARASDQCSFGKWLQSLDVEAKKSPNYRACQDLHSRFHTKAAEVLDLALSGKKEDASRAMEPGSQFNKASTDLTRALMAWARPV